MDTPDIQKCLQKRQTDPSSSPSIWQTIATKLDPYQARPQRMEAVTSIQQTDEAGQDHYILKNKQAGAYIRLDARGYFLWQLMDGTRTVRDLIVEYTLEFKRLRHESILQLLNQLRQVGFLKEGHHDVYVHLS